MSTPFNPSPKMKKLFVQRGIKDKGTSIVAFHIPDKSKTNIAICEKNLNPEILPYSKYGPYCQTCIRIFVKGTVNG